MLLIFFMQPALALENQNSSTPVRAAVVGEPQPEDVTRSQGNLSSRLGKLEKEVAEERKKVLELLGEKDKFEVLKRKVGKMGQVLEKFDGFEEVGRVVRDARELRREVAEVKEMMTRMERAVESASDVSATTKVHMSEIALLKEDAKKQNADHAAVRAEVLVLKEEMEESALMCASTARTGTFGRLARPEEKLLLLKERRRRTKEMHRSYKALVM